MKIRGIESSRREESIGGINTSIALIFHPLHHLPTLKPYLRIQRTRPKVKRTRGIMKRLFGDVQRLQRAVCFFVQNEKSVLQNEKRKSEKRKSVTDDKHEPPRKKNSTKTAKDTFPPETKKITKNPARFQPNRKTWRIKNTPRP